MNKPNTRMIHQLSRAIKALRYLAQHQIPVEEIKLRRGAAKPIIRASNRGRIDALKWSSYVWGRDERGAFQRLCARYDEVQITREVRDL